jgi:methionyl-tRNA formyltransferase
VTLHKMVSEIDAGPIVYQAFFEIGETDTALAVYSKCIREGLAMMLRLLDIASTAPDAIPLHAQDMTKREYFGKEVPNDGLLFWSSPPEKIVNFVRACDYLPFRSPWGQPKTWLADREIRIVKARRTGRPCKEEPGTVGQFVEESALVSSTDEWILVEKLKIGEQFFKPAQVFKMGDRLRDFGVRGGVSPVIAVGGHGESHASSL